MITFNCLILLIFLCGSTANLQVNPQNDLSFEGRQHRHRQRVRQVGGLARYRPAPVAGIAP
jgi:hypothetical protein